MVNEEKFGVQVIVYDSVFSTMMCLNGCFLVGLHACQFIEFLG